jgi:hypothetical protein
MPFTTNVQLEAAIADWLARPDLTAQIPDFVRLFECDAARRLKVRPQATTTTLTPTSGVATLPTDYLGYQRVTWGASPFQGLEYVTPALYATYLISGDGIPTVFTIEGESLKVAPSSDTDITLSYFQRTGPVATGLQWLFNTHPDAYLAGSLAQAAAFNKGFDVAGTWLARCNQIFEGIQSEDFNERQGMAVRTIGATP